MITGAVQFGGDSFQASKITILNKTGGALVKGGVYALDLNRADAASTDSRKAAYNVKAVAAGNIGTVLCVAEQATPDGEEGLAVVFGKTSVRVEGTVAVASGDRLKAVAGQNHLVKASAAVGSVDVGVGCAMAAQAGGAGVVMTDVLFDGIAFNKVINAAVS